MNNKKYVLVSSASISERYYKLCGKENFKVGDTLYVEGPVRKLVKCKVVEFLSKLPRHIQLTDLGVIRYANSPNEKPRVANVFTEELDITVMPKVLKKGERVGTEGEIVLIHNTTGAKFSAQYKRNKRNVIDKLTKLFCEVELADKNILFATTKFNFVSQPIKVVVAYKEQSFEPLF